MLVTEACGGFPGASRTVAVIILVSPEANDPRTHGNAVVHAPAFDAKINPAGVGSVTVTAAAAEGPALVTISVYVATLPARITAGPVWLIDRSAVVETIGGDSEIVAVALLFARSGSIAGAAGVTEAVLTIEFGGGCGMTPAATKVARVPAGKSTVVAIEPDPSAEPHAAPAAGVHDHVTPNSVPN